MNETTLAAQASQGFISYRRDDNIAFRRVVDQLRADISNTFEARTGRSLDLFLDRDSIGWGEDWRERIRDSVRSATVFIPIITMRYFTSQACRDELIAFHEAARRLGVTELILPIILVGAENVTREDDRPEVRLIESLNYKNIESQFRSGYDSPEWLNIIDEIVRDLIGSLQRAEDAIIDAQSRQEERAEGSPVNEGADGEPEEADLDLTEIYANFADLTPMIESANEAVERLGQAAGDHFEEGELANLNAQQVRAKFLHASKALEVPAKELEVRGKELEERMTIVDGNLRSIVAELEEIDNEHAQSMLQETIDSLRATADLSEAQQQIADLIEVLKFASLMNVSLRKALKPAIQGARAVQTAASTFDSWKDLGS